MTLAKKVVGKGLGQMPIFGQKFTFHSNKNVPLENSKYSIANSNIGWPTSNKFKWVLVIAKQMALIALLQEKEIVRVIVLYLQILLRQIWFASRHH